MRLELEAERESVNQRLREICAKYLSPLRTRPAEAVAYGLMGPGKRLRPLMLQLAYLACGGRGKATLLSCAPEVIHASSLIHDDLPCMDDADMRRGRPTMHRVYDPRTAVIAGLILIPVSVMVVRDGAREMQLENSTAMRLTQILLLAVGEMIGGQVSDLAGEGRALSLEEREAIHSSKTAALIAASLQMGAAAAQASSASVDAFARFGRAIGLAFQIMDDVMDVTSTSGAMGKTAGRDVAMGKSTYPALLGVEGARDRAASLIEQGTKALAERKLLTQELSQVANFMLTRTS